VTCINGTAHNDGVVVVDGVHLVHRRHLHLVSTFGQTFTDRGGHLVVCRPGSKDPHKDPTVIDTCVYRGEEVPINAFDQPTEITFETAAEHASTRVPVAAPGDSVADIRAGLWGKQFDTAVAVAVCEQRRFLGLIRIEDLIVAESDQRAIDVMDRDAPIVAPGVDQEKAAWKAVSHGEATLAVVDETGVFQGVIPPARMLSVLLWEHDEDLARLGGFQHDTLAARQASTDPLLRRFRKRMPWLLLGLMGALAAAGLVGSFEESLQANVLLAFFLPGIVYMADAVGTQTETLLIRGLSVGVSIRQVVGRELATGALVGATVAAAFYPLAVWLWGDVQVALAAALSLLAACSIATVVAMLLPYLFTKLGKDPAFGSGPLGTVIQDLLSILIYFAITTSLVA
jgi:magnesium transporter